jgi:hypothetical protein
VKSKRTKSQTAYTSNLPAKLILKELLADFEDNNFDVDALRHSYKGPSIERLRSICIDNGISKVDFDLAIDELDQHGLIKTGPPEITDSPSFGGVLILPGIYSKREYAYLKEGGYREAKRLALSNQDVEGLPKSTPQHKGVIVHGDQYINYGEAGAMGPHSVGTINHKQQWAAIQNQVDLNALAAELEALKKHLKQSASSNSDFQTLRLLVEAEQHARKQDGSKVIEVLSRAGKGLLDVAKEIGTDVAAKVIAKSMGLEP